MDARVRHRLGQGFLLLVAVAAVVLSPLFLLGAILLYEAFPEHPILAGLTLLLVCGLWFLCFVGSTRESLGGLSYISRVLLVLFSVTAAVVSLETFVFRVISLTVAGSWNEILTDPAMAGAAILLCLTAAGIKYSFRLRIRYWIILLATFAATILFGVISQLSIFVS